MSICYSRDSNNYELEKEKDELYKNKKYLAQFNCCNEESCDDLAYEYEKLLNKCHDVYSKVGVLPVNDKGRLDEESLCDTYKEIRDHFKNKYSRGGNKRKKSKRWVKKSRKSKKSRKTRKSIYI
jgi:hypothetical protein